MFRFASFFRRVSTPPSFNPRPFPTFLKQTNDTKVPGYNHVAAIRILEKQALHNVSHIVHVFSSRNNTRITCTDHVGKVLVYATAGTLGLKKSNRSNPEAGYNAVSEKLRAKNIGLNNVELKFNGFGKGRETAFKAIRALGWHVTSISDVTPIRHAGCRPKRKRRL